jgi:hypothetical protein
MNYKKPGGRPPLDPRDPSVHVGVALPGQQYDAYAKQALREGVSVPEIIRRELQKKSTK